MPNTKNTETTGTSRLLERLYFAAHQQRSTALLIAHSDSGVSYLEFVAGWIHKIDVSGMGHETGEQRLAALLKRDYVSATDTTIDRARGGECRPFHPALALRNFVETLALSIEDWRRQVGGRALRLRLSPHSSCLAADERPLVALLSEPRTLHELEPHAALPQRLWRLLTFLAAVGALEELGDPNDFATLELSVGATVDEIKHAYHRLANQLHPDRHVDASKDELEQLATRFAEISAAYRRLASK